MEDKVYMDEDISYSVSDPIKKRNYQTVIKNFNIKKFNAIEQEDKADEYDLFCELKDGTILKIEFKNRRIGNIYGDVALEVYHNYKNKYGGCVFNLINNKVDYYIYTWHDKPKRGYIIFKAQELGNWWKGVFETYKHNINKTTYDKYNGIFRNQSSWCAVPIKDIPKEIIYKYEIFPDLNDFWSRT